MGSTGLSTGFSQICRLSGHQVSVCQVDQALCFAQIGLRVNTGALAVFFGRQCRRLGNFKLGEPVLVPQYHQQLPGFDLIPFLYQQLCNLPTDGQCQPGALTGHHRTGTGIGHGALHHTALNRNNRNSDRFRA